MTRPLAIWDVDGTLVDSRAVIFDCCKRAMTGLGQPEPSYDAVRGIVGLSLKTALARLGPDLDGATLDRAVDLYKTTFQAWRDQPGNIEPLYDGAARTLARLKAEGWRLAIATGKSRRGVDSIVRLHGWEGMFDSTHCADDGPGKPHPSMVLEAMRATGAQPARTIMIGDTSHDMAMARAAGAHAQGVTWGFNTAEEMRAAGAHDVVDDFSSLDNRLDAFAEAALV